MANSPCSHQPGEKMRKLIKMIQNILKNLAPKATNASSYGDYEIIDSRISVII